VRQVQRGWCGHPVRMARGAGRSRDTARPDREFDGATYAEGRRLPPNRPCPSHRGRSRSAIQPGRAISTARIATSPGTPMTTPGSGLISTTCSPTNTNRGPFSTSSSPDQKVRKGASRPASIRCSVTLSVSRHAIAVNRHCPDSLSCWVRWCSSKGSSSIRYPAAGAMTGSVSDAGPFRGCARGLPAGSTNLGAWFSPRRWPPHDSAGPGRGRTARRR
jgi:hypothetical protein